MWEEDPMVIKEHILNHYATTFTADTGNNHTPSFNWHLLGANTLTEQEARLLEVPLIVNDTWDALNLGDGNKIPGLDKYSIQFPKRLGLFKKKSHALMLLLVRSGINLKL